MDHLLYTILVLEIFYVLFCFLLFWDPIVIYIRNFNSFSDYEQLFTIKEWYFFGCVFKLHGVSFFFICSTNADNFSPVLSGSLNSLRKTLSFLISARSYLLAGCFTFTSL